MHGRWIVVASQKTTKIFTEVDAKSRLKLVEEFDNPLGRARKHELISREAGTSMRSAGGSGAIRSAKVKRSDPHEQASIAFAKEIINFLNTQHQNKNFEALTIVAEPNFLGMLRSEMKPKLESLVKKWIKKDLLKTPKLKLEAMLLTKKN